MLERRSAELDDVATRMHSNGIPKSDQVHEAALKLRQAAETLRGGK